MSTRAKTFDTNRPGPPPGIPGYIRVYPGLSDPNQFVSNVLARVLIFVDLWRMSQLACSFLLPMQIPSNVLARVLLFVDLCRMS